MRILSIGNFTHGWDGSVCDEEHVARALEGFGHEVVRWQREDLVGDINSIKGGFDFVLIAQWDGYPDDLSHVVKRYTPSPLVYWAFDHQAPNQEWHNRLKAQADLYLSKMLTDVELPNWRWLSQDFAPEFLDRKAEPVEKDIDVLFTGSHVPFAGHRIEILKAIDERFSLKVHSVTADQWKAEGLKDVNGPVMDEALIDLIARAKINISVDIHTDTPGYWSDRNAQIMACGGFVLYKYTPMSEARFGGHIDYFNTVDECLEKIQLYLDNPSIRETIADYGYHFAKEEMMVSRRVADLLTIVRSIL